MKIYTKKGDNGQTSLNDKTRLRKSDKVFDLLGDLDELNAAIGIAKGHLVFETTEHKVKTGHDNKSWDIDEELGNLQCALLDIGAVISAQKEDFSIEKTDELEKKIDNMTLQLKPLKNFILPGGDIIACHIHMARTICRRAERHFVAAEIYFPNLQKYLNRLSDYLFTLARYVNMSHCVEDVPYSPSS